MANLSAYIDFSITLFKDASSSSITLVDPNHYPPGVASTLKGYFIITQPDGITITGNYITPDIYWNGVSLTLAVKELRLRSTGGFEQGTYTFTYNIIATGYDETTLTKSFDLSYTTPTPDITANFDVFIPTLSVTDNTDYTQTGMSTIAQARNWEATIISVEGTNQDITGNAQTFDLSYLGTYYDSRYDVSLTSYVSYLIDTDTWVVITDQILFEQTYYAFIPPTIDELLELLTAYKAVIDSANCICGSGCVDNCTFLKSTYSLAVSIYTHIVERGRKGQTAGLDSYVLQLQKLLSNCVTPDYTNTNDVIPAYDWGSAVVGTIFTFFKQMIVGSGVNNAPPDGATTYTDSDLITKHVIVYLDGLLMGNSLSDRVSTTYNSSTGTITWNTPLSAPQVISIYTYS